MAAALAGFVGAGGFRRRFRTSSAPSRATSPARVGVRQPGEGKASLPPSGAYAALLAGDHKNGIAELRELCQIRCVPLALLLAAVLRRREPEIALSFAPRAEAERKGDGVRESRWRARCGSSGGRRADREASLAEREPGQIRSIALAIRARIALERGDLARAERLAEDALCVSAGEPFALIARAHVWAATRPPEQAARAVEDASAAARNNPFALLDEEVAELEELTARRTAVTG
jgi:hypothetical protein